MKRYSGLHNRLCTIENIQKVTQLQQKHNELVETVEELETKLQTYSDKVDNLETRVQALENSSQS